MNIVFLGTPDFAVESFKALINSRHNVLALFCQPDRPGNRGKINVPATKQVALEFGIKVYQPESISKECVEVLRQLNPDLMVTCAYGQMLSKEILEICPVYNIHASLLPAYRGSAPIQWAIINGDKKTGVTIMKTNEGMDTGDILMSREIEISEEDTAESLFNKLSILGSEVIIEALDLIESGNFTLTPQDESKATKCKMLKKEMGKIDFSKSSSQIVNLIRGTNPWPSAYCFLNDKLFKIHKAKKSGFFGSGEPGEVVYVTRSSVIIACGEKSFLELEEVQLEGSRKMSIKEFIAGNKIKEGDLLK